MEEGARVHHSYGFSAPSTYGSYEPRRANPSTGVFWWTWTATVLGGRGLRLRLVVDVDCDCDSTGVFWTAAGGRGAA